MSDKEQKSVIGRGDAEIVAVAEQVETTVSEKTAGVERSVTSKRRTVNAAKPASTLPWKFAAVVVAGLGSLVWGAWVTKNIVSDAGMPPMARVQLSGLVGEYVQAQARSSTPPEMVAEQTKQFMATVEGELKNRADKGQVILVSEAVVSSNVPDVTEEIRRAVYAKVKMPQTAAANNNNVMASMQQVMNGAPMASPAGVGGDAR